MTIVFRREANGRSDGSSASVTATYSSNNLGDMLCLGIGWEDSASTDVSTVVDGAGNAWTSGVAKVRNASIPYAVRLFYVPTGCLASASTNTVTVTLGTSTTFKRLSLIEYRSTNGPWTSNMRDKTSTGTGTSKNLATGSMTPAGNDQLVLSFGGINGTGNIGATSPYVARATDPFDAVTGMTERVLSGGLGVAVAGNATSLVSNDWLITAMTLNDVAGSVTAPVVAQRTPTTNVSSSGKARILLAGGR